MITTDNTYTIDVPQIFNKAAKEMTSIQSTIAGRDNVKRTGALSAYMRSGPYNVAPGSDETTLTITYPMYMRYLDLRLRGRKPKKKHTPIYNKYLWGFLMGYIYSRTRGGIARFVAEKLNSRTIEI